MLRDERITAVIVMMRMSKQKQTATKSRFSAHLPRAACNSIINVLNFQLETKANDDLLPKAPKRIIQIKIVRNAIIESWIVLNRLRTNAALPTDCVNSDF